METGYSGTFVISWSQTEIDSEYAAATDALVVGASWRWSGKAVRVDGPGELLRLDGAKGSADLRKRAAKSVRRLLGAALSDTRNFDEIEVEDPLVDNGFTVTDGRRTFAVTMIDVAESNRPLLMFLNELPPANTDLWIVHRVYSDESRQRVTDLPGGVICFTAGTQIRTEQGLKLVQDLGPGDKVLTKDNGAQEIQWVGARRMSGARLYAMPELRPIRFRAGALNAGEPDEDLLVSPNHRMLVKGDAARVLFNAPEVLVAAKDLLNDRSITVDYNVREVTYVHLMFEAHQVLWANGVETESFHPANMSLHSIEENQRAELMRVAPDLAIDAHSYGDYARRNLSASEAAILQHDSGKFPVLTH